MKRSRGIALPLTLLAAAMLVVFATWMLTLGLQSLDRVKLDHRTLAALYAAEAGLASAADELSQNSAWGQPGVTVTPPGYSNVDFDSTTASASFTVVVTNNSAGQNDLTHDSDGVRIPAGTVVPTGCALVSVTGHSGSVYRTLSAVLKVSTGIAVFSAGTVNSGKTDALVSAAQHAGLVPVEVQRGTTTLSPGTYGDVHVSGGTLVLQSGEYDISNLHTDGGVITLNATPTAPVRLHFYGSIGVSGSGDINAGGPAASLVVYQAGPSAPERTVSLEGTTRCSLALYAPTLAVNVAGDTSINGGLVATTVHVTEHARVVYDEGLKNVLVGGGNVHVVSYGRQ